MKKSLLSLAGIMGLCALFVGFASAQLAVPDVISNGAPVTDAAYTQILNNYDNTWGYSENNLIEGNFRDGDLHVISPIMQDIGFDDATVYYLFVSPYRVEKIKAGDSSVDVSNVMMSRVEIEADANNVEFILPSYDLDSEQAYYGFIAPVDMYDEFGTPSNEICFQLSSNTYNQGEGCDAFDLVLNPKNEVVENVEPQVVEESHGSACVGMNMANVSHVVNGDTITLKWTAVDGDVVQIAVFDPEEAYWKSLGAVSMKDEKFTYKIQWNGEQNFMLTNGCGEVRYKADAAIKTPEKETVVPPATGPAENILYIAIAAIVLYGAYVLFFRKSEN